jgi:hypothetical protein
MLTILRLNILYIITNDFAVSVSRIIYRLRMHNNLARNFVKDDLFVNKMVFLFLYFHISK